MPTTSGNRRVNRNTHVNETVNYIAWEPGKGTVGSVQFEVATTANAVTDAWYTGTFQGAFTQSPMVLADMQTTNNTDTSALRMQQATTTGFQVKVEEEKSYDSETTHPAETVGYLAFNAAATQRNNRSRQVPPSGRALMFP